MLSQIMSKFNVGVWALVALFICPAVSWGQEAAASPAQVAKYQQAVSLLNQAEQTLSQDPEKALALTKQAGALFNGLQKELATVLRGRELNPTQVSQESRNKQIAQELYDQGQKLEKSAEAKLAQSEALSRSAQTDEAQRYAGEAHAEYQRALSLYVKSQLASLRNQQMIFDFLRK